SPLTKGLGPVGRYREERARRLRVRRFAFFQEGMNMATADATPQTGMDARPLSREKLIELLNQDLAREYQAIISYVVYSQVLKGAEYMNIAGELEKHAQEELQHALILPSKSIIWEVCP